MESGLTDARGGDPVSEQLDEELIVDDDVCRCEHPAGDHVDGEYTCLRASCPCNHFRVGEEIKYD